MQGFEHKMGAGRDGHVPVAIINPKLAGTGLGLYLIYNSMQLPKCLEWRMMGEGQYVVGIELCTNSFGRERVPREGEITILGARERRTDDLEIGVLDGIREIEAFRARVTSL